MKPWDFSLWVNIQERMEEVAPSGQETKEAFKHRLRRAALATPAADVRQGLLSMKKRAQAVSEADGRL